jgi:hypothetical protein
VLLTASNVAGVIAQTNWNNGGGGSGSLINMKNEGGVTTTADASWSAVGTWHVSGNGTATGDAKMMNGYLDAGQVNLSATVTLSQIPYAKYDVYIYVGGSNPGAKGKVNDGTTWYSLTNGSINPGGNGFQYIDYLLTTDTGTGYPMANYAKFAGRTSSSVTVTIGNFVNIGLPSSDEGMGIFGVQIVEVNSAVASNPGPADDATFVSLTADLSWTVGLGAVSHDVYFGTNQAAVTAASRLAGDINGSGSVGIEDITVLAQQWLGTPAEPYADLDGDDDVNLADFAVVSADWLASADAVYKGNQSGTTYEPGTLAENTTYYWRIDEIVAKVTTTGAVWSFTTGNLQASSPSPSNGATSVSVNANLSWSAGVDATSHNVYFGTSSPGTFLGNQSVTTFDPGTMAILTAHYWRIDEVNAFGTTTGQVWSFTTSDPSAFPRVIVSTDIGGYDNDDFQSMVHYLTYANMFDTEGLISSPPGPGRASDILTVINHYETDYSHLSAHGYFPTPQSLRDVTKQGAINAAPSAGYSTATDGSNLIITRANVSDSRPLWVLTWGSITDVAQAVHDNPGIKSKIHVLSTGSWNTMMDPYARAYLYDNHSDMWWIEINSTMRGMYEGGNQSGDLDGAVFRDTHVCGHGALGDFYCTKGTDAPLKMGDTPEVLYMLNGDQDDPTTPSWGGMYGPTSHGSQYWTDLTDPIYREGDNDGAKTVNMWREAYLRDWQTRMDWADGL